MWLVMKQSYEMINRSDNIDGWFYFTEGTNDQQWAFLQESKTKQEKERYQRDQPVQGHEALEIETIESN